MSVASSTTPGIEENSCSTPFDFHGGDGCAFDGAEQRAAKCIADGGAPAALKRLRAKIFRTCRSAIRVLPPGASVSEIPSTYLQSFLPGEAGHPNGCETFRALLGVKLDDQLLVERRRLNIFALAAERRPRLEVSRGRSRARARCSGSGRRCAPQAPWCSGAFFRFSAISSPTG